MATTLDTETARERLRLKILRHESSIRALEYEDEIDADNIEWHRGEIELLTYLLNLLDHGDNSPNN